MSIILGLWVLAVALAMAAIIISVRIQRFERTASEVAAGILLASLPFVFIAFTDTPLLVAAAAAHVWLLVLPGRMLEGRLERPFLRQSSQWNAFAGVAITICLAVLQLWWPASVADIFITLWLSACLAVGVFVLGQLWWNTRRYYASAPTKQLSLAQLPTVTVCIPARNEDHALTECLTSVLASTYPKLEVIVLDDCSQDATSAIIRSFAHDGVRFIQGDTPAAGWLGKNQALDTLAQHASGQYLLFIDVDTHLSPQSITNLVYYTLQHQLEMVSVLPQNRLGLHAATACNTLDFYWRQVLPLHDRHAPTSSKAWLIAANSLRKLGGFASVSRKIVPEESFASRLALKHTYRFLLSNDVLGFTTAKRWASQVETAVRVMYPRLRRQPILVLLGVSGLMLAFFAPFAVLIACIALGSYSVIWWLSLATCAILLVDYATVLVRTQPKSWFIAMFMWPIVVVQEFVLFIASMVQYEFGEVNWKGRNVCYPVLASGQPRYVPGALRRQL
jgi:hypothetical protein